MHTVPEYLANVGEVTPEQAAQLSLGLPALWSQHQIIGRGLAVMADRASDLRHALASQHGEPAGTKSAADLWGADPQYAELLEMQDAVSKAEDCLTELALLIERAEPCTPHGLRSKASYLLASMPRDDEPAGDWKSWGRVAGDMLQAAAAFPDFDLSNKMLPTQVTEDSNHPDAALIMAANNHLALIKATDAIVADDPEKDLSGTPEMAALHASGELMLTVQPQTLLGVLALAIAVKAEAGPEGGEHDDCNGALARRVSDHLLRLAL